MKANYEAEMTRLEDAARRQTAIGEMAHAYRTNSRRSDWVDAAHYAMTKRPLWAHRLYKGRGVKWRDVYRVARRLAAKVTRGWPTDEELQAHRHWRVKTDRLPERVLTNGTVASLRAENLDTGVICVPHDAPQVNAGKALAVEPAAPID